MWRVESGVQWEIRLFQQIRDRSQRTENAVLRNRGFIEGDGSVKYLLVKWED